MNEGIKAIFDEGFNAETEAETRALLKKLEETFNASKPNERLAAVVQHLACEIVTVRCALRAALHTILTPEVARFLHEKKNDKEPGTGG